MHVAGRAPKEIGLPLVAEIMNAAAPSEKGAVDKVHAVEGNKQFVSVTGAWRVWFEHPAAQPQIQGSNFPAAGNTNPDHSFEIHPLTDFAGNDLAGSFYFIPGFTPKDAKAAFEAYEKLPLTLRVSNSAVTLSSSKSGYNYVEFMMKLVGTLAPLQDGGLQVLADVYEKGATDEPLVTKVRMILVPNTPPWQKLKQGSAGEGDEFDVLGIPRVNLNAVSTFIKAAGQTSVKRKLPYEMIIVGMK